MMKNGAGAPPAPAVAVRGLRVARGGRETLHGLSFTLPAGSVTGLLGPSGCGKTTLMRTLVGVQRYDGEARVLGHEPAAPAIRGRVGYVTQGTAVYKDLTARQNLRYFASLAGPRARDVDEVLDVVGLTDLADRRVSTYSGGEANRASLACALVAGPELLVLDEPTVGLDPLTREDLWDAFQDLAAQGATLLGSATSLHPLLRPFSSATSLRPLLRFLFSYSGGWRSAVERKGRSRRRPGPRDRRSTHEIVT